MFHNAVLLQGLPEGRLEGPQEGLQQTTGRRHDVVSRWVYDDKFVASVGLEHGVALPFTRLENRTWLHDRSERDVYGLLIDAYRLRVEDMYNIEGEADTDSIYGGAANGLRGFKRFLGRVERCPGLLPPWWDAKKKKV
ncbi:uncharacterized protein HRG_10896 [Hirsutella rhossiliensis]|uniref:Uncharacterized protein n=1 Tax=Hirsutella rhossiliensis TaxID=111463 RepID=A0A9P8MM25_9HYPO|nr:uncharacterized protein HRG_10896 [Hirsutella rhossiliensis]KAH0957803.1 hypothetical protein HRG_10896 [Hirsutella rhossiliensis]